MENVLEQKDVVAKGVAIKEIQEFVKKYNYQDKEDFEIEDDYPQMLMAIQKGLLKFDEDSKPKYTLAFPLSSDGGNFNVTEITFRTRIKPSDLSRIMKGIDASKQQFEYILRCLSYLTGEPKAVFDKIEKFDYKVIEQVATVFF